MGSDRVTSTGTWKRGEHCSGLVAAWSSHGGSDVRRFDRTGRLLDDESSFPGSSSPETPGSSSVSNSATSCGSAAVALTRTVCMALFELDNLVLQLKKYSPGIGWTAHIKSSNMMDATRCHVMAILQSSAQLSIMNNCLFEQKEKETLILVTTHKIRPSIYFFLNFTGSLSWLIAFSGPLKYDRNLHSNIIRFVSPKIHKPDRSHSAARRETIEEWFIREIIAPQNRLKIGETNNKLIFFRWLPVAW